MPFPRPNPGESQHRVTTAGSSLQVPGGELLRGTQCTEPGPLAKEGQRLPTCHQELPGSLLLLASSHSSRALIFSVCWAAKLQSLVAPMPSLQFGNDRKMCTCQTSQTGRLESRATWVRVMPSHVASSCAPTMRLSCCHQSNVRWSLTSVSRNAEHGQLVADCRGSCRQRKQECSRTNELFRISPRHAAHGPDL